MDIKLYILHDDRRMEKYPLLMNELIQQGITKYEIVPAILDPKKNVIESINAGHKAIIRKAKENKLPFICVAEDDLMFTAPDAWQFFLKNIPETYDLYVASTYLFPIEANKLTGFHLYICHEKFYDKFLSASDTEHIDNAVCDLRGDYKICYPFPCLQRPGWSSNSKVEVNYQIGTGVTEKDIYRG